MGAQTLEEVQQFATGLFTGLDQCRNGEGSQCSSFDNMLEFYAKQCCAFTNSMRDWAQQVFTARIDYDASVEAAWRAASDRLYERALELDSVAQQLEGPCFQLDARTGFRAALWQLHSLRVSWVKPSRSVSPAPRGWKILQALPPEELAAMREQVRNLPKRQFNMDELSESQKARLNTILSQRSR